MRIWSYWVAIVLLSSGTALAQSEANRHASQAQTNDEEARNLFRAGKSAYEKGNYSDALSFFEEAYERSLRPALLYNIGQAADRLRQDEKAIASFRRYLEQTPDASNRDEVEQRLQALEQAQKNRERSPAGGTSSAIVPTPEQVARQGTVAPGQASVAGERSEEPGKKARPEPITKKWWFWGAIGAVVLGGTITALALASGGTKTVQEPLYQGNGKSLQAP